MYEHLTEMSRNDDYTSWNLLIYQNYYNIIGLDFSRQANTSIPQQTNFIEKLEEDNRATMSFNAKNYFNYCNRIIKTMKHQDILNLMHEASDSKFLIRKWDIFKLWYWKWNYL